MWVNRVENTVDGVDEDGNGFVDDVHGWDFDGKNNTVYRRDARTITARMWPARSAQSAETGVASPE